MDNISYDNICILGCHSMSELDEKLATLGKDELKEILIKQYKDNLELLANNRLLKKQIENSKKRNPRGAGRPKKIDDIQRVQVIVDYAAGVSEEELAERFNCSVYSIKKVISEAMSKAR